MGRCFYQRELRSGLPHIFVLEPRIFHETVVLIGPALLSRLYSD